MIDLSKLGGSGDSTGTPAPTAPTIPTQQQAGGLIATAPLPELPGGGVGASSSGTLSEEEKYANHNWVWDKLGRAVWGDPNDRSNAGILGQVPIIGDIGRAPGLVWSGITDAGGVAVNEAIVKPLAGLFSRLPSTTGLTDYNLGNGDMTSKVKFNDPKYTPSAEGAVALMNDLVAENGQDNIAKQFMILGQWQQANDPESFKLWQKTLDEAQKSTGVGTQAGEMLSTYMKHFGVQYNDMTSTGVEGLLDVMPEMAYGSSGSFGQGLTNDLSWLTLLQRKAERGAAVVSGRPGGIFSTDRYSGGHPELGSRLDDLLGRQQAGQELTDIEQIAADGMTQHGWTSAHAMNFLLTHGQGYSSDPNTQLALGFALDPITVASLGAGLPAKISARVAMYANTAESATRIGQVYRGVAKAIGTTVEAVRSDPILGPISKVTRSIIDPFSALPGPHGQAKVDVLGAAGLEGFNRGMVPGTIKTALNRAKKWGAEEVFNEATGVSAANQTRKWVVSNIVDNLLHVAKNADVPIESRQIISEDVIQHAGQNAAKDAVSRVADFVYANRKFWLSSTEKASLAERIAKTVNQPIETVLKDMADMSPDEQALWHQNSYSKAFTDWRGAIAQVPAGEWGALEKRVDDLVILNPHELDHVAAQTALADLTAATGAKRTALWNALADKYDLIDNLGRVKTGGARAVERKMNALQTIIDRGGLHTALDAREMKNLPNAVKSGFLDAWTDSAGKQMWRVGFKPSSEMATGLLRNEAGDLVARFAPTIDNVTTAIRKPIRGTPVADALGRVVPGAVRESGVGRALGAARDTMETTVQVARDAVSGERVMNSMEQSFVSQLRSMGVGSKAARNVFKMSREFAQERGFTIAGMTPDDFFKVAQPVLTDVDAKLIKSDVYTALVRSAGGDMRLLGLTPGVTQRLRSGLTARGLNPNNFLGQVSVEMYSRFRYALNPTFFIQAVADAPWFNMYRGIGPVLRGGKALAESPAIREMKAINDALGHTGLYRDLAADITDRAYTIGWQQNVRTALEGLPGVKEGLAGRVQKGVGNMILANELKFMNSKMGQVVYDALDSTQKFVDDKIANAANAVERESWQNARQDSRLMIDNYKADLEARLGRVLEPEEVGRRYLAEVMGDSTLEQRAADGTLDYSAVYAKGQYHLPTTVGKLEPLNLDHGAVSLGLPNVHSITDLRVGIKQGTVAIGDVTDIMKENGVHPGQIKRFVDAVQFNWRSYFDGLRSDLGMTQHEMAGVEDLITREARNMGMSNIDYITQVKSVTAGGTKGVAGLSPSMQRILSAMRLADKGQMTLEKAAELALDNMHPSMKDRLLASFEQGLTGTGGMIEKAQAAGDAGLMRDLNKTVEELRGGWTPGAGEKFKEALRQRIGSTAAPSQGFGEGRSVAQSYNDKAGLGRISVGSYVPADAEFGKRTAAAYAALPITDPAAKPAYEALAREIDAQYQHLVDSGIKVEPVTVDPYKNSAEMIADVRDNKRLKVYASDLSHPFLTDEQNLRFRAVHDFFGHAVEGYQFGPRGEFNASLKHAQMFSDEARPAMLTETHGQNSWVNYGPKSDLPAAERPFAQQKAALLPQDILNEFDRTLKTLPSPGAPHPNPEVERAFRYFSQYVQELNPKVLAGEQLRNVVDNIPVAGASAYDMTQHVLMNALGTNFRLAERDAIRLAHMPLDRSVLDRSLNHPFFGMYPSSYWWGKVIPETFKFIAAEPFGLKTTLGAEAYYKVQQNIALQSQYDDRMQAVWDGVGKSAVVSALSYLSPGMPWEDMKSNLPPWAKVLGKSGFDITQMAQKEFDTMSPIRWMSHFLDAGADIGDTIGGAINPPEPQTTLPKLTEQSLQGLSSEGATGPGPTALPSPSGPVQGAQLGPTLTNSMEELQRALSGG